jgi:predicted AlkP superfamily pyrophosphatase or phosphodiesterase
LGEHPTLPDYGGACVSNIVPNLLEPPEVHPEWMPAPVAGADQVVLLTIDGLGWEQLQARRELAPHLSSMEGGPARTVVPSTTATAMTSITTGLSPGEHGVIGYRIHAGDEILNVLRWSTPTGDARRTIPPHQLQPISAFCGHHPPVVTRAEFATSGFTTAHLNDIRFYPYRMPSTLAMQVATVLRQGESFVYAYYDGIDKVAHEYGLGEYYDAELVSVDQLVGYLLSELPSNAALLVTSDHGQIDVGDNLVTPDADVLAQTSFQSGEGRFRWFHARPGRKDALLEAAIEHHEHHAWIKTRDETIDEGWFGPEVTNEAASRLGDVALVAQGTVAFVDPADTGPFKLIARHGSLTAAEMLVPLLASRA